MLMLAGPISPGALLPSWASSNCTLGLVRSRLVMSPLPAGRALIALRSRVRSDWYSTTWPAIRVLSSCSTSAASRRYTDTAFSLLYCQARRLPSSNRESASPTLS